EDLVPERDLADVGVDIDEEAIFVALCLPRGMREDIARIRVHGDFLQFLELRRSSLEHFASPDLVTGSVTQEREGVQLFTHSSFRVSGEAARPGIHSPCSGYGFREGGWGLRE